MEAAVPPFPDDVEALKLMLSSALQNIVQIEANARGRENATAAISAHLKLQNAKLRREQYGPCAERTERLLAQGKLDLEAGAAEDGRATKAAAAKTATIAAFERRKPTRNPLPDHLLRERVVIPVLCACPA